MMLVMLKAVTSRRFLRLFFLILLASFVNVEAGKAVIPLGVLDIC
jgi:hypothetical protein